VAIAGKNRWRWTWQALASVTLIILGTGCGPSLPWPNSSVHAVVPLSHPTLDQRIESLEYPLQDGFRFVVMGDQQVLADGELQSLVEHVARLDTLSGEPPLLFILDTGDIVREGQYSDQFHLLQDILSPVSHLPYLVAVGNHEVDKNREGPARENLGRFMTGIDPDYGPACMYYRKDVGSIRLISLDTNEFIYGGPEAEEPGTEEQLRWLVGQLAKDDPAVTTIVALHHPFVHSSKMHRAAAQRMWNLNYNGRSFAGILADGGVDIVVTGHTHTYERFTLTRHSDGHAMAVINISGRPRRSFLFFGAGRRRCQDIRGMEYEWLADKGWQNLDGWEFRQDEAMSKEERNQLGMFSVQPDGRVSLQMHYLTEQKASPLRTTQPVFVP